MHSQPYLRPKRLIPDEKYLPFLPFFGVQGRLPVAHCHCGGGSGGLERPSEARAF